MTVQTLYTAATGMEALETKLDVIANNMANINTTGFKKDRANFEDVFYRQYRLPGAQDADGNRTATGIEVGLGTRVSSTQSNFKQARSKPRTTRWISRSKAMDSFRCRIPTAASTTRGPAIST